MADNEDIRKRNRAFLILLWLGVFVVAILSYNYVQGWNKNYSLSTNSLPYQMVYQQDVIKYNDSDLQLFGDNLKYTLASLPYDLNGDGYITQADVTVYIANKKLATYEYQIKDGTTVLIPAYLTGNQEKYTKGAIIRIEYAIAKR